MLSCIKKSEFNDLPVLAFITFINWQEYNQCTVKESEKKKKNKQTNDHQTQQFFIK
jgi:hypothetical protein